MSTTTISARPSILLRPVVQGADTAFLLNDRPDLAAELGCDGVHVGQEDAPYAEARRILGPTGIVGVTCHDSRHLAMEAAEAGADYVAFGAFFPTATKRQSPGRYRTAALVERDDGGALRRHRRHHGRQRAGPDRSGRRLPGGLGGVWDHPDGPQAAVRAFNALFRHS